MKFSSLKRFSSTKQDLIRFSNPLDSWQLGNLGKQDYDIDIDPDHHDHNQYHWMDPVRRIQAEASQYSLGFHASSRLILNEEEKDFDKLYFNNNSIFSSMYKHSGTWPFHNSSLLKTWIPLWQCLSQIYVRWLPILKHISTSFIMIQ